MDRLAVVREAPRGGALRPGAVLLAAGLVTVLGAVISGGPVLGAAGHTVQITMVAGKTPALGGFNFNGFGNGAMTVTVPVGWKVVVSIQDPISLPSAVSEPQLDIALLVPPLSRYTERHAGAGDVLLLIGVADTSAADYRSRKLPLYARAGISEVWLIDLANLAIECYRSPSSTGYADVRRFGKNDTVTPQALPQLAIRPDQIIG